MATVKELAVKFSEQGLKELQTRLDQFSKKAGKDFASAIQKAQELTSAIKGIQAGVPPEGPLPKQLVDNDKLLKNAAQLEAVLQQQARAYDNALTNAFRNLQVKSTGELKRLQANAENAFRAIMTAGENAAGAVALDMRRAQRAFDLQKVNLAPITQSFRALNLKSTRELQVLSANAKGEFQEIAQSAEVMAADVARAQAALFRQQVTLDPVIQSFRALGGRARAELNLLKRAAQADFEAIRLSGTTSAQDVAEALRLLTRQSLNLSPLEAAFRRFKIRSTADIEAAKREIIADFLRIKRSGITSAEEIEAAFRASKAAIRELNAQSAAAQLAERQGRPSELQTIGIRGEKEIRAEIAGIEQALNSLKAKGGASFNDISRAAGKAEERIQALRQELLGTAAAAPAIQGPFEVLGLKTTEEMQTAKRAAVEAFKTIKQNAKGDLAEVERAARALKATLRSLNEGYKAPRGKSAEQILGLPSRTEIEQRKAVLLRAFREMAAGGRHSASELTAAFRAMTTEMKRLDRQAHGFGNTIERKLRSPFRRLNAHLASLAFETTGAVFALGALGAAFLAPFKSIGELEGKFQRVEASLRSLNDTAEQTAEDMAYLEDLALSGIQPFGFDAVLDAFIKLKSTGIDPTTGALELLLDAVAATKGIDDQALRRAAKSLSDIASKGKVEAEEFTGQLAEAVAGAPQQMAEALGKSLPEIRRQMETTGLGARTALTALFTQWEKDFKDASQNALRTWDGVISAIGQSIDRFKREIARAGIGDEMMQSLEAFRDTINRWIADGTMQRFAENISLALQAALRAFETFVELVANHWDALTAIFKAGAFFLVLSAFGKRLLALAKGLAGIKVAFTAARTAALGFRGALLLVGRATLVALGPAGWLTLAALAIWEISSAWRGAKQSASEYQQKQAELAEQVAGLDPVGGIRQQFDLANEELQRLEKRLADLKEEAQGGFDGPLGFLGGIAQARNRREQEAVTAAIDEQTKAVDRYRKALKAAEAQAKKHADLVAAFKNVPEATRDKKGEDDATKALRADLQKQFRLVKDTLDREKRALQASYDERKIAIRDFYSFQVQNAREAIDEEIALKRKERELETDAARQIRLTTDIILLERKRADVAVEARRRQIEAERRLEETLVDVEVRLLEQTGKVTQARAITIEREYRALRQRLETEIASLSSVGPLNIADQFRLDKLEQKLQVVVELQGLDEALAEVEAFESKVEAAMTRKALKETEINTRLEAGLLSQLGAQKELRQLYRETYSELDDAIPNIQRFMDVIPEKYPHVKARLQAIINDIKGIGAAANTEAAKINAAVEGSLVQAFDDLLAGVKDADDAIKDFADNVIAAFRRILAERFAEQLMARLRFGEGMSFLLGLLPGGARGGLVRRGGGLVQPPVAQAIEVHLAPVREKLARIGGARPLASGGTVRQADVPAASSGVLEGPGTGTSDSIATRMVQGAYVLRAAAVRRYRPYLDALVERVTPRRDAHPPAPPTTLVPVRVSSGEYVFSPEATRRLTAGFLSRLNRLAVPVRDLSRRLQSTSVRPENVTRLPRRGGGLVTRAQRAVRHIETRLRLSPEPARAPVIRLDGLQRGGLVRRVERLQTLINTGPALQYGGAVNVESTANEGGMRPEATGEQAPVNVELQISDAAVDMTLRDWLEGELARIAARR